MIPLHEYTGVEIPLLLGAIASAMHVWTGPDHLAAVTPLVFNSQKNHWKIGAFWGIGHLTGMLLIGFLFYLFKDLIPVDNISQYSEQLVGLILIGLGIWSFYKIKKERKSHIHPHIHEHENSDYAHVHKHKHHHHNHEHSHEKQKTQNYWAATGVGIIHGFAGISHFLLMLPALAFENHWESAQYLVGFAIGTLGAMIIFSIIIGKFHLIKDVKKPKAVYKNLQFWGGIVAVAIGIFWIFQSL
jgi:ABC-type nickel/cobalt efflux system permease component RcnA